MGSCAGIRKVIVFESLWNEEFLPGHRRVWYLWRRWGWRKCQPKTAAFEVASLKPCSPEASRGSRRGDGRDSSQDRLHLPCQTLLSLIQWGPVVAALCVRCFNLIPSPRGKPHRAKDLDAVDSLHCHGCNCARPGLDDAARLCSLSPWRNELRAQVAEFRIYYSC